MEATTLTSPDSYTDRIRAALRNCLVETSLYEAGKQRGKVRDRYDRGERLVLVTTDRQSAFDRVLAAIPFKGQVLNQTSAWWFEQTQPRTLSTMFAAGVPLVEAMESVAGATGNIVYENAVMRMRDEVATGQRLQRAMENTALFPNMVVQMIAVGEESGSLDAMSAKVAEFYELEVDSAVDGLSSLLEPLIMAILGVLVGGLVIAMYLPIFKLGAVI
jgi:type IV pilus assembly protein PilC